MTNSNVTRYVRYLDGGQASYGVLEGDTIQQLDGCYIDGAKPTGKTVKLADVKLTLPLDPDRIRKVIGVDNNYEQPKPPHVAKHPSYFPKFHTSLVTEGDEVELPIECTDPHQGASMVLVIGKEGRNIARGDVAGHIFGITVGNDITDQKAYDRIGGNFTVDRMLGKANDTWGPVGTQVVTGLNYNDLALEAKLNGKSSSSGRTSQMVNSVEKLVHYLSHYITLEPGDLIWTGYPPAAAGLRAIKPGDELEVSLEGVGSLHNRCVALKGGDPNPWWLEVFKQAAEDEKNAEDVKAAAGPMSL